jgi:hypothetical protein
MAGRTSGDRGLVLAIAAVVACCAVPALVAIGAGFLVTLGGALARYWPLTALGLAVAAWGGFRVWRVVRARRQAKALRPDDLGFRSQSDRGES